MDEGFKIPSLEIAETLKLKRWSSLCIPNVYSRFSNELVESLYTCFQFGQVKSLKRRRERMWENYHKLRCSSAFKSLWSEFLAEPILFQHLTDTIIMLIRIEFSLTRSIPEENKSVEGLDLEEKYALRYAAGYVLKKKVRLSGNPMKNELELCLNSMEAENDSECPDQSDKWTIAVDRGHVSDTVFQVFAHMELTLRAYLKHRPMDIV